MNKSDTESFTSVLVKIAGKNALNRSDYEIEKLCRCCQYLMIQVKKADESLDNRILNNIREQAKEILISTSKKG